MQFTPEQRKEISEEAEGKVIQSLEWDDDDEENELPCWVLTFTDGSQMCFQFMSELVN